MGSYIKPPAQVAEQGRKLESRGTFAGAVSQLQPGEVLAGSRTLPIPQARLVEERDYSEMKDAGWEFYAIKQELADTAQ